MATLGIALAANSAWLLLGMVPPLLYLELVVIPREEAALQREFGDAFTRYCEDTPRCVGVCIPCYASLCGWWEHHQYVELAVSVSAEPACSCCARTSGKVPILHLCAMLHAGGSSASATASGADHRADGCGHRCRQPRTWAKLELRHAWHMVPPLVDTPRRCSHSLPVVYGCTCCMSFFAPCYSMSVSCMHAGQ